MLLIKRKVSVSYLVVWVNEGYGLSPGDEPGTTNAPEKVGWGHQAGPVGHQSLMDPAQKNNCRKRTISHPYEIGNTTYLSQHHPKVTAPKPALLVLSRLVKFSPTLRDGMNENCAGSLCSVRGDPCGPSRTRSSPTTGALWLCTEIKRQSRNRLLAPAERCFSHSPGPAAELRKCSSLTRPQNRNFLIFPKKNLKKSRFKIPSRIGGVIAQTQS